MNTNRKIQRDKRNLNFFVWIQRQGVQRYFNLGQNRRSAERRLREIEDDIAAGRIEFAAQDTSLTVADGVRDMRLEELAVRHLDWVRANRANGTFGNRRHFVRSFLDFMGPSMVSDVTRPKLEEFYTFRKQQECRRAKREAGEVEERRFRRTGERTNVEPRLNPNAGAEAMSHVKAMLRWGYETELCDLAFRKFPEIRREEPEALNPGLEIISIIITCGGETAGDIVMFGVLTGLRPMEVRCLGREHLKTDADGLPFLSIAKHKTSRTRQQTKPRSVPLCVEAVEILDRQTAKHPKSNLFFLNADGKPYTRYSLRNVLRRACARAGVKAIRPYALRHAFASLQSGARVETNALADLMGHSTTRTLRRYVDNIADQHWVAIAALSARVNGAVECRRAGGQNGSPRGPAGCKIDAKVATEVATENNGRLNLKGSTSHNSLQEFEL